MCSWGAKPWYWLAHAHAHWSWTARCKLMTIKFAPYLNIRNAINYKIDTCERDKNIVLLLTNKFLQSLSDYSSCFREFLPETQHCWAQNLGIEYSGWTDLINGGNFFIAVCCSLLNRGTQRQFSGKYLFGRRFEI